MISRPSPFQPPQLAAWLVDLFIPGEHAESIPGDLLEEFSEIASRSGLTYARRWYWRQSIKTIGQLVSAGFRAAPWLIIGTTVGGFLLFGFGYSLPDKLIDAVLEFRWHHVVPYFTQREMDAYLFWYSTGILAGRLLVALIVGCIVAIVAKAREMVATLTLSFVFFALNVVVWFKIAKFPLPIMLTSFAILIAMGGIVVREVRRAARGPWHSSV